VQQKVSFPNGGPQQTPGVIVMHIDDTVGPNIDPALKGLVVVFNASDEATTQTVATQQVAGTPCIPSRPTDPTASSRPPFTTSGPDDSPSRLALSLSSPSSSPPGGSRRHNKSGADYRHTTQQPHRCSTPRG
jgi:hypothetical protein